MEEVSEHLSLLQLLLLELLLLQLLHHLQLLLLQLLLVKVRFSHWQRNTFLPRNILAHQYYQLVLFVLASADTAPPADDLEDFFYADQNTIDIDCTAALALGTLSKKTVASLCDQHVTFPVLLVSQTILSVVPCLPKVLACVPMEATPH